VLMGGKVTPADFGKLPGREIGGRVLNGPNRYHAREYDRENPGGGALKYFDDGNPIYGVTIDLDTTERVSHDDNGTRRLYADKPRMLAAIRDAIRAAGAEKLERDGYLFVRWTGEEEGKGTIPAQTFSARYTPPGAAVLNAGGVQSYAPPAPPPATAPVLAAGAPYIPAAPPVSVPYAGPAQVAQAAPVAYAPPVAPPPAPQVAYAPPVAPLPESVYLAMRNAGLDVSAFTPVPGG